MKDLLSEEINKLCLNIYKDPCYGLLSLLPLGGMHSIKKFDALAWQVSPLFIYQRSVNEILAKILRQVYLSRKGKRQNINLRLLFRLSSSLKYITSLKILSKKLSQLAWTRIGGKLTAWGWKKRWKLIKYLPTNEWIRNSDAESKGLFWRRKKMRVSLKRSKGCS